MITSIINKIKHLSNTSSGKNIQTNTRLLDKNTQKQNIKSSNNFDDILKSEIKKLNAK